MDRREFNRLLGGAVALSALSLPALGAGRVDKSAEQLENGEFNWYPERSPSGPIVIIVSIPDQMVHVYRNGIRIAASTCSTGKPGHGTPTGVFKILQKDKHHRSSTYNNAPMPNMNRLTWSGVALHAGKLPGYPASHGCVRLPMDFSELLFGITTLGMTVIIADDKSNPRSVTHPGMVLGDYAAQEYAAVDTAVMKHAYAQGHTDKPISASVVISGADRTATVWENGKIVAEGKVDIENPDQPIGGRVYTLTGAENDTKSLRWATADYSTKRMVEADLSALKRIRAQPGIREEIRKRMHYGMTLVTTDGPSSPEYQTASDFVIFNTVN
jgi:L,D-transpeptidase catalytic domain